MLIYAFAMSFLTALTARFYLLYLVDLNRFLTHAYLTFLTLVETGLAFFHVSKELVYEKLYFFFSLIDIGYLGKSQVTLFQNKILDVFGSNLFKNSFPAVTLKHVKNLV